MIRVKKQTHIDNSNLSFIMYESIYYNPFTCGLKLIYMNVLNKTFYNSVEY